LSGMPIAQAIRWGILNSTSVIQHSDAKTGLLTKQHLKKQLVSLGQELLKTYPLS
jgi:hypothetical protein